MSSSGIKWFYECDPEKNKNCEKSACGTLCMFTTYKKYAKNPDHPIEAEKLFERQKFEELQRRLINNEIGK